MTGAHNGHSVFHGHGDVGKGFVFLSCEIFQL